MASPPASPEPAETANQLKVTDLADVLQLLSRHDFSGVNYYTLGLYLGLSPATLAIITRDNKGDTKSCLRECLTKWLQKDDGVQKKGGPTISSLVSALRELGENAVADGIDMEKHPACKILADHACTSNKFLIAALPQLTALLHSEELIKEIAHTEKDGETLMIEILKAVCLDFKKLEKFAAILIKKKATMEIGNAIEREYRKVYYHHKGNDDLGNEDLKPQVAQCDNIHDILKLVRKDCSLDDIEMLKAIVNELNIESAKVVIQEYSDALEKFSETELKQLIVAARNNIDVLKKNKVKRLTIGYCTVYEATETVDTPTLSYEKQLLSISSGLSKQLILSLSVQLINSTEEVTTLNEELKNKMQSVKTMENEISKQKSDETGQLLHQKVTESETDDASNLAKNLLTTESSQFTQEAFGTSFESATTKVHLEHEALWCNGLACWNSLE
uniref:Death domain-containing protein n=1 Tax=Amphimedon queenslandica TaxID=400682 RepID=A0A1X7SZZ8_AMPQE